MRNTVVQLTGQTRLFLPQRQLFRLVPRVGGLQNGGSRSSKQLYKVDIVFCEYTCFISLGDVDRAKWSCVPQQRNT